ncbi:hypothetical protein [Microcoleus anatoxicus]
MSKISNYEALQVKTAYYNCIFQKLLKLPPAAKSETQQFEPFGRR